MKKADIFDVLVVYTNGVATSARKAPKEQTAPFSAKSRCLNYNDAYAYFLESCKKYGLKAAFTTSGDIIGAGLCLGYWVYSEGKWATVKRQGYARQIFDKFSPINEKRINERELLFSNPKIVPFNNPFLLGLFFDKLATYTRLSEYAIPTVELRGSNPKAVAESVSDLRAKSKVGLDRGDFTRSIIIKDRNGAGGNLVFKVDTDYEKNIFDLQKKHPKVGFVLQPFLQFKRGFTYNNTSRATDIRLIYQNNEVIQTYIRMAKENDFRCNEHQGGTLIYVDLEDIPSEVIVMADDIVTNLAQNNSLFSLDFVISDQGKVYFLEGNIGPGLDWDETKALNKQKSHELIQSIVNEMAERKERIEGDSTFAVDQVFIEDNSLTLPYALEV